MLILDLYSHQWKSFFRNSRWRRNWFSRILGVILVFYLLFLTFFLGQNIETILKELGDNPFNAFNSTIIFYFSFDLLLRCFLQYLPTIQIVPYLRLKIKRSVIINHMLYRSLWNIFNLIPFLVIIPFIIKIVLPQFGVVFTILYFLGFCLFILLNNYLATLFNYLSRINLSFLLIPFLLAAVFVGMHNLGVPIMDISISLGMLIAQGNLFLYIILLTGLMGSYALIFRTLSKCFYIDENNSRSISHLSRRFVWLDIFSKYGEIGTYFSHELKLLFRNKRPRQGLFMLPIIIIYFSFTGLQNSNTPKLLVLLMISCIIAMGAAIYGQFIFSWESSYFDGLMARKNNLVNYIKAKYFLMISMILLVSTPLFILLSITVKTDLFLLLSILLFILGFMCFIIIFFGTYNDGRIDLSQSQFFNYQGVKGNQFILSFLLMLLPIGIYMLFNFFFNDTAGKLVIAIPGLIFVISHDWWIKNIIVPRFMARKYKNLEGFRKLTS